LAYRGRALAITFLLQIVPSRRVGRARVCPRVSRLMYPLVLAARCPFLKQGTESVERERSPTRLRLGGLGLIFTYREGVNWAVYPDAMAHGDDEPLPLQGVR
jgi:hypothetical protein